MTDMALRCYVKPTTENTKKAREPESYSSSVVLVLDTETTTDEYQNLLFGSCGVWMNGKQKQVVIFYNEEHLGEPDVAILKAYADKRGYRLMCRQEFVEMVFFPYVYNARAVCVGFNLPFDLSRLAQHFGKSRKYENGLSLQLSYNPHYPRIAIRTLDSKRSFIGFTTPMRKKSEKKQKSYKGCFLDLRTLLFALTNQSYKLKDALVDFQCERRKIDVESHGRITEEYIDYNVNDTLAAYELYEKALERYSLFCLDKHPSKLYSPASIGKAILDKLGVRSFREKNPEFSLDIMGYLMTAYYGGRVEVRIRKEPRKVTYLDFTSMYPSLYVLLGLDKILKSDKIEYKDATEKTQEFLDGLTLDTLRDKGVWAGLNCICCIRPYEDILPVRSKYSNQHVYNIGLNYVSSSFGLWYALPDLIASKLLTGKTPRITKAICFTPVGVQPGLEDIEVLRGVHLTANEDIFKTLIEERIRIKNQKKTASDEEKKQLDLKQVILKIIANSASYGIYIEITTKDEKQDNSDVYGLTHIQTNASKTEVEGQAFNPIMATMITSGARLILAMAEALVTTYGGYLAYCDTDSIFINPEHEQQVKDFFRPLNPYDIDQDMFKVEEDKEGIPLKDVWFYGISAKRYCLYDLNDTPKIRKFSSHGLGENLMGLDQKEIWEDILKIHYDPDSKNKILAKYANRYAVYNFRVSSYNVWMRFKTFNQKKPLSKQIKPYNFVTIGIGYMINDNTKEPIIPMLPFIRPKDKQFELIPHMPFIDYKSGTIYPFDGSMDTQFYWKPISKLLNDYIDHKESKSQGDIGTLKRKQLNISRTSIQYIGKESNELDTSQVIGVSDENYTTFSDVNRVYERVEMLKEEDLCKIGVSKRTLYYWKACLRENMPLKLKKKILIKLNRL